MSLLVACVTNTEGSITLDWGESAELNELEVKPTGYQIGNNENPIENHETTEDGQVVIVDLELSNRSNSVINIDKEFYYNKLGILYDNSEIIRMDLDLFPFDVYVGDIQPNETVNTNLIVYTGTNSVSDLIYNKDNLSSDSSNHEEFDFTWPMNNN